MDIRCDAAGKPNFMEVNPLAGMHPEHSDLPILATKLGVEYRDLIGRIIQSAQQRIAATPQSLAQKFDAAQRKS